MSGELSVLSVVIAEARFIGHGISQILMGMERLFWLGLDRTGVRSLGGVLFWHKCLGLMDTFVKEEVVWEMPIME